MTTTLEPVPAPAEGLYARRWWALAILCLSLLIVFVGNSSLNVALPKLSTDLHATESQLQWVDGLIEAPSSGWTSTSTLAAFAVAIVVLGLFVAWEMRVAEPMLDMHYFRNPAFSTGTGGMILVFLSMYGVLFMITQYFQLVHGYTPLQASLRTLPIAVIMVIVSPLTPRLSARFGANKTVAFGMFSISFAFCLLALLGVHSPYAFMVVCFVPLTGGIALTMSPMTASIMSAVPARRAGAGSAMNDATRELGAALGIAVLGSVAVSRYDSRIAPYLHGLSSAQRSVADTSIAGALRVAGHLPAHASTVLTAGSEGAFVSGLHLAALAGAVLALCAGLIVVKYLPASLVPEGAVRGPVESAEDMAELGIAGGLPAFADMSTSDDDMVGEARSA